MLHLYKLVNVLNALLYSYEVYLKFFQFGGCCSLHTISITPKSEEWSYLMHQNPLDHHSIKLL